MGKYLNPTSHMFRESLNSEIYIDKTGLLTHINRLLNTSQKYLCISRPRRFGKTCAANMMAAYYGCGEDTAALFDNLEIAKEKNYRKHLNHYHVIKADIQTFVTDLHIDTTAEMVNLLTSSVLRDIKKSYPDIPLEDETRLHDVLFTIYQETGKQFIFLIDEWDCIMRKKQSQEDQQVYLEFIRTLLKDQPYVALAYMTGILPIKKYGEHSALNMFSEYSMIQSHKLVPYFGFTKEEVRSLCEEYDMSFATAQDWYDGYHFLVGREGEEKKISMYSPRSVVLSMMNERYDSYWSQTETYEALKDYIEMNFDGLQDAVVEMLAGGEVEICTTSFQNDMTTFYSKDDVLTLLVHLGYLSYHADTKTVAIPNKEVEEVFVTSIRNIPAYGEVFALVKESKNLLESLWTLDTDAVAAGVEKAHLQFPSLRYNSENALSCTMELAFYYAREYYTIIREMPTGKGFADICFLPKPRHAAKPAVILELKWNQSADAAIDQIKRKEYPEALDAYQGNLLLCGINYDKDGGKKHSCTIEKFVK